MKARHQWVGPPEARGSAWYALILPASRVEISDPDAAVEPQQVREVSGAAGPAPPIHPDQAAGAQAAGPPRGATTHHTKEMLL